MILIFWATKSRLILNVKCELCENSIVWSYGLELHYSQKHQGLACPLIVGDKEKSLIMGDKIKK